MAIDQSEALSAVKEAVVGALGVDDDEVSPDSTLMDDLGAESIDLLDILFRIERSTGVKIQAGDLSEHIQGGVPDDEFSDENEVITDRGFEQLQKVMPQIDVASLKGNLKAETVIMHFTVQNLADMVTERAAAAA
jgi:acyl carrier protein